MAIIFSRIFTENNPVMGYSKTFCIPEAKGLKVQYRHAHSRHSTGHGIGVLVYSWRKECFLPPWFISAWLLHWNCHRLVGCLMSHRPICSLCRPVIEYGAPVWLPHQKNHIECLESVQWRFTRSCFPFNVSNSLSYEQRLSILHLPPLYNRLVFLTVSFIIKCLYRYNSIPTTFLPVPNTRKLKLCFLNISTAGLTVWNFLHLSSSPDFMNLFLVTWETFVLNLHISHLLILYVITFTVIVLFLMPTSSSPSWLQFGNSGIISACTLLCNNCHIHVHANCDSVFIYLNNILIWLCCF